MAINTKKSAKPIGAYVHAKEVGGFVFLSGIGPRDPETDKIVVKTIKEIYGDYIEGYEVTRTTIEVGALPTPIAVEFKVVAHK